MELIGSSAQVNFFTTGALLVADSSSIIKLMPLIQENYMPSYGEEVSDDGSKNKVFRLQKEIGTRVFSITFALKGLIIQIDSGKEVISANCFDEINKIYSLIVNIFDGVVPKANRLSVVINNGYKYHAESEQRLLDRFFKIEKKTFEWNFRQAFREVYSGEDINYLIGVNRGMALSNIHGNVTKADTILFTIDNNTTPDNIDFRFNLDDLTLLKSLFVKSIGDIEELMG